MRACSCLTLAPWLVPILALLGSATLNAQPLDPYLKPTLEAQADPADATGNTFHPDLVAKANELETPLRMFEFVHDEIEYEVYRPSRKGALGALWSRRANDRDQAALLIALLRAKGIRARYVIHWIDVPMEQAQSWTGALDAATTRSVFDFIYCNQPLVPPNPCSPPFNIYESSDAKIRLPHAWVEMESSAGYRGLGVGTSDPIWIPLDPSWKQKDYRPGLAGVPGTINYDAYYSKVDPRLPTEILESGLQAWLALVYPGVNLAAKDVVRDGPIRRYDLEVLPLSLPFDPSPIVIPDEFGGPPTTYTAEVSAEIDERSFVSITIEDGPDTILTKSFQMPDVVHRRLTVSFEPRNDATREAMLESGGYLGGSPSPAEFCLGSPGSSKCETVPVIKVDGVICAGCRDSQNRKVALGSTVLVKVNGAPYQVAAGTYMSVGVDAVHAGSAQVDAHIDKLLALRDMTPLVDEGDADLNANGVFGETLINQGSPDITECPDYAAPTAIDNCDISIAAHYKKNDDFIGELLHLGTLRYFQRLREEERRYFALRRLVGLQLPAAGVTLGGLSVEYLFDRPVGVEPSDPVLDVRNLRNAAVPLEGPDQFADVAKFVAHVASALEHQVWEELIGRQFVSTVKGFQIVRERFPTEPIRRYDSSNAGLIASELLAFPFDTSLAAESFEETIQATPGLSITTPVAGALGDAGGADVFIHELVGETSATYTMLISVRGAVAGGATELDATPLLLGDFGLSQGDANLVGPSFVTADPVSMVSGNNYLEEVDLRIPTNGPPLEFVRAYNSQNEHAGELGFGWTHGYEIRVEPPQQDQEFVYLPSTLTGFDEAGEVDGARSDSIETWNSGTGVVETAQWPTLPAAFTSKATVERVVLELTYDGAFDFQLWNGATQVLGTTAVPNSGNEIALETYEVTAPAPAGPYELRLTNGFGGSDRLFSARLRIHFRGPRLERVALPNVPDPNAGWSNLARVSGRDPSSCATPSTSTPPALVYPTPTDLEGAVAIEVSAAVKSVDKDSRAMLRLGTVGTGPSFLLGPNEADSARLRFITLNTAHASDATFQTVTSPIVELCHLERTLLRMRDEVELVLATGVRERFTRAGGVWQGAPGVRNVLTDRAGGGYIATRPDGSQLEIGKGLPGGTTWRLSRIADAQGRGVTLEYDSGTHRLLRAKDESDPEQRFLAFTYEAGGDYLTEIEDWSGRTWRYTVDSRGDLVEFANARAVAENWQHGVRYEYEFGHAENPDLDHNLKRVIEPEDRDADGEGDRWVEFSYYNNDKVSSHTDSVGSTYTFLFNVPRLENQTTDPRGLTTVYRHDTDGNLVQRRDPDGAVWEWKYDKDRNVVREIDPFGRAREFLDFDEKGNPGEVRDRDWSPPSFTRSTHFTYDPVSGRPATVIDKRGHTRTVTFTTDGLPLTSHATIGATEQTPGTLLSTNQYNAAKRLSQVNEVIGDEVERQTHFFYDPTDRDLIRVESWDGGDNVIARTELDYDVVGRPRFRRVEREASASDPTLIELVTEMQYDPLDQVVSVIQPDGTVLLSQYDKNGNLTRQHLEERRPDGQIVQHGLTRLFYDAIDRLVETVDAASGTTTYAYDAAGNRVAMTDPEGNTWRTEYDAMNRPVRAVDPNGAATTTSYDAAGRVEKTADATGLETLRTYDRVGRLVAYKQGSLPAATRSVEYGDGSPRAYHETVETMTGPELRTSKYEFDGIGRVFEMTDALDGVTQVAYNLLGSVKTVTDPIGKQTLFSFDTLGRAVSVKSYYAGLEQLTYDQTGNVIRRQKPDLCQLEQDYDAMGRRVARRTTNSAGSCADGPIDDAFGYDARGLLVAAQNDAVGLIREYDALGRMRREIDTRFGTGVGYAYDSASRLTSKVYPDGSSVHYTHDGAGRTVGISDPFGDTTRFVYDAAGRRVQKLGTDGVRTDYTYDATTRFLTSVGNSKPGLPFALFLSYPSHDDVGNRLTSSGFGGITAYTYDKLDRLLTLDPPDEAIYPANGAPTEFAYDAAGNRTDFGPKSGGSFVAPHTTYTYASLTKRLTEIRVDGALVESLGGYDGNGNPSSWTPPGSSARTLKYDGLGRLVSISGGFTASYVYDPFGRRIEKTEASVTTRYQYDGLDVVAEYSASQLEATYVFGPGIDEVLKLKRNGVEAEYHTDGLGSVMAVSASGAYRNTYVYDAFGQVVATGGSQPLANAYTYTGRERDASGLYYYRARYYLPSAGRFLTPDPIGLQGGLNAYAYVGSNPVNYTDPFGLRAGAPLGPAGPRVGGMLTSPVAGATPEFGQVLGRPSQESWADDLLGRDGAFGSAGLGTVEVTLGRTSGGEAWGSAAVALVGATGGFSIGQGNPPGFDTVLAELNGQPAKVFVPLGGTFKVSGSFGLPGVGGTLTLIDIHGGLAAATFPGSRGDGRVIPFLEYRFLEFVFDPTVRGVQGSSFAGPEVSIYDVR